MAMNAPVTTRHGVALARPADHPDAGQGRLAMLATGGTGGHVFPALALAEVLLARGFRVDLTTDRRGSAFHGLDPRIQIHRLHAGTTTGHGPLRKMVGAARLLLGLGQAWIRLMQLKPSVVVGFGGYPSLPPLIVASRTGRPTLIHDQNAVLGRANRLLAMRAVAIATSFDTVAGLRPQDTDRIVRTGNPVRAEIARLVETPYSAPELDGPLDVLVLGGSQGAHIFSTVVPEAIKRLPHHLQARLHISQQVRPEDLSDVSQDYEGLATTTTLRTFFTDIPQRLGTAHLVICRAGGSTVAELTTAGRPAILVPFPGALDQDQAANAQAVDEAGGGWLIPQSAFTPETLASRMQRLLTMPDLLARAAAAAGALGRPLAAEALADLVAKVALPAGGQAA
jgi:UDP-N-acetylglucosamine--N-acetylmuramyl-(pentapeptide) pyrophosphoryl-undecaprenol N-acetylglucosamine transferase